MNKSKGKTPVQIPVKMLLKIYIYIFEKFEGKCATFVMEII